MEKPGQPQEEEYNRKNNRGRPHGAFAQFRNHLRPGAEAPDFTLPDLNGKQITLSRFRGKNYVVLEFGSIT